jgi:uncharacterized membrane protein
MLLRRLPIVRQLFHRPRLILSLVLMAVVGGTSLTWWPGHRVTGLLIAYNLGTVLYLVLAGHMMVRSEFQHMRWRARVQDGGGLAVLGGVVVAAIVALLAMAVQVGVARDASGIARYAHEGLAALTVLTSWSFTQVMFALHYAHTYYDTPGEGAARGLDFPGTEEPDYVDFLYAACAIGTSGQAADVCFTTRSMRRIGLLHCVLAFFFNAFLIGLTINLAAGLMQ